MSKKLLAITFLVSLAVTLISVNSINNDISQNSINSINWVLPAGLGIGMMMICGVIGIRKFFGALSK
ncbi:MAG: hypothetical protein P4K92_03740 [Candidatus Nitrosotalea sp.]|nr:hypothetical protein [Candidatus Nitrosotalea sp.]